MLKQTILTMGFLASFSSLFTQNLIKNGDCELPTVNAKIPNWIEVQGTEWRPNNTDVTPQNGQFYFYAGGARNAELMQEVDVTDYACPIDAGGQKFEFKGFVRAFPQNPTDQARIILEYRNANNTVLSTYDSGNQTNTNAWALLSDSRTAPAGTRKIRIRLISTMRGGTDNDGYYDNLSLTTSPTLLKIDTIRTQPNACVQDNGEIHFSVSGGKPPYKYVLTDYTPEIVYTDSIIKNLNNGTYHFSIRDNNGCAVPVTVVVPFSLKLARGIFSAQAEHCGRKDGKLIIRAVGGKGAYVYKLNNGAFQSQNQFDSIQANLNYSVTIKDSVGCVYSENISPLLLRSIPGPTIDSIKILPANCDKDNGRIQVSARIGHAPIQYSLDSIRFVPTSTFSNLRDSSYTVYVSDTNKCVVSKNVIVPRLALPKFDSVSIKPSTCARDNGNIAIAARNVTCSLDSLSFGTSMQFLNLRGGNYTIYIRDTANCTISQKVNVPKILPPNIDDLKIVPESCQKNDGQIIVKASSTASRLWFSLDSNFTQRDSFLNLSSGIFTISVRDSYNCVVKQNITLQNQPVPIVEEIKTTPSVCDAATGIVLVKAKGGRDLLFSLDGIKFQNDNLFRSVKSGQYNIVVKDGGNCKTTVQTDVPRDCGLFIPTVFSPNGDGNNDYFTFFGDATKVDKVLDFKVFNRWGNLLFNDETVQINNINSGWDGKFRGQLVESGIYVFYLKVQFKDGTTLEEKGDVTLLR